MPYRGAVDAPRGTAKRVVESAAYVPAHGVAVIVLRCTQLRADSAGSRIRQALSQVIQGVDLAKICLAKAIGVFRPEAPNHACAPKAHAAHRRGGGATATWIPALGPCGLLESPTVHIQPNAHGLGGLRVVNGIFEQVTKLAA